MGAGVGTQRRYLMKRAEHLGVGGEFALLGRIKGQRCRMKDATFSSKAYGTRESKVRCFHAAFFR